MEIVELQAQLRETTGKNKARQLRATGKLPVILYGNKEETSNLMIDVREFESIVRARAGSNLILKLKVDGGETPSVMVKDVQRDPVRDYLIHIDFLRVALDEKVIAAVPIKIVGESVGIKEGGILQTGTWEVQIEALPAELPENIEVDITQLDLGESIHAGEITLPDNLTMASVAEEVVASIVSPTREVIAEEVEEEVEEGEAAEEAGSEEQADES